MNLEFRQATEKDIPGLVALLADDELGATREDISRPLDQRYIEQEASDHPYAIAVTTIDMPDNSNNKSTNWLKRSSPSQS